MQLGNENIRMFLLRKGFNQTQKSNGYHYILCAKDDLIFSCNLINREIGAEFPDFRYNSVNIYSPKNKILHYQWNESLDDDDIIHNIETFIDKVMLDYQRR